MHILKAQQHSSFSPQEAEFAILIDVSEFWWESLPIVGCKREELMAAYVSAAGEGFTSDSSDNSSEHKARHHLLHHKLSLDDQTSKDTAEMWRRTRRRRKRVGSCKHNSIETHPSVQDYLVVMCGFQLMPSRQWKWVWGWRIGGGRWWLAERGAEWVRRWKQWRRAKTVMRKWKKTSMSSF